MSFFLTTPEKGDPELRQEVDDFTEELRGVLWGVLPGEANVEIEKRGERYLVRVGTDAARPFDSSMEDGELPYLPYLALTAGGKEVARLKIEYRFCLDSQKRYLAVAASEFHLFSVLDRTPMLRLEFKRDMHSAPAAHWQVGAERGMVSYMLAKAGAQAAHSLQSLHLPVGGSRFRPCLEDLLQFLIQECGIDRRDGWRAVVTAGRDRWHTRQLASAVRDMPERAAKALRDLNYVVSSPASGPVEDKSASISGW